MALVGGGSYFGIAIALLYVSKVYGWLLEAFTKFMSSLLGSLTGGELAVLNLTKPGMSGDKASLSDRVVLGRILVLSNESDLCTPKIVEKSPLK